MAVLHGWRPNWFEPENWGFKARFGILAPNMPKVAHIDDPDDDGHPPVFAVVYGGINSLYCNSDVSSIEKSLRLPNHGYFGSNF